MKSVLISIQPKWVEKIASGKKTIEVRKSRPNIETPFKCYIYCTKVKNGSLKTRWGVEELGNPIYRIDGKVIGEFVCDRIEEVYQCNSGWVQENACLSQNEFFDYLGIPRNTHFGYDKKAYGWHISELKIYDKPKELSEFKYHCKYEYDDDFKHCYDCDYHYYSNTPSSGIEEWCSCDGLKALTRPPQSWCYVESLGD